VDMASEGRETEPSFSSRNYSGAPARLRADLSGSGGEADQIYSVRGPLVVTLSVAPGTQGLIFVDGFSESEKPSESGTERSFETVLAFTRWRHPVEVELGVLIDQSPALLFPPSFPTLNAFERPIPAPGANRVTAPVAQ
jgi:hypothetical protein